MLHTILSSPQSIVAVALRQVPVLNSHSLHLTGLCLTRTRYVFVSPDDCLSSAYITQSLYLSWLPRSYSRPGRNSHVFVGIIELHFLTRGPPGSCIRGRAYYANESDVDLGGFYNWTGDNRKSRIWPAQGTKSVHTEIIIAHRSWVTVLSLI
jgi:hypothetical protein